MDNKPILYIEINFVLVDFHSGFEQIGFENLAKYKNDLDDSAAVCPCIA